MPTTKTTKEAAQVLGVSVGTLRNWSDQYAGSLGETARPGHQPERRFADKDLTVLTYIKQLRAEGLQAEQIRERLAETTFQDVEILQQQTTIEGDKPQQTTAIDLPTAQGLQHSTPAPLVALVDLERLIDAKLEAIQRVKEPSFTQGLLLGVIGMGLIFLVGLGLALLYGGFR